MVVSSPCELASRMIDILSKEEHYVYFESFSDFKKEEKPKNPYLWFRNTDSEDILKRQFLSVGPEVVIFLRDDYESQDYSNNFRTFLDLSADQHARFFYLSNMDVAGRRGLVAEETSEVIPSSRRGETAAQCEYLTQMAHKNHDLTYVIMRADQIYGKKDEESNLFTRIRDQILSEKPVNLETDQMIYPIHCDDLVYAFKRSIDSIHENEIYHVLGNQGCLMSGFYSMLAARLGTKVRVMADHTVAVPASGEKIRTQLEWVQFHDLDRELEHYCARYEKNEDDRIYQEKGRGKRTGWQENIRKPVEVFVLFLIFGFLDQVARQIFGQENIDFMMIYIVIIALRYHSGFMYSAVSLTVIYNFLKAGKEVFELYGFIAFADQITCAVLYLVVGIMISFVVEGLRNNNTELHYDNTELEQEKQELLDINAKILTVKNEYEKRILSTKFSFSSLYTVLNRISVLHPQKIMVELMNIIADVLETDTVSIYTYHHSFARLMVSINEESIYCGKSWNLPEINVDMYDCLKRGEIYRGDTFQNEPALVAPIMRDQAMIALVVINKMKFENMSMYYINLLKTLVIMSGDMIHRANEYFGETRNRHYLPGTTVFKYQWFKKEVQFEKENSRKGFSTYFIVRCIEKSEITELYQKVSTLFRSTDFLGMDGEGHLCVLFKNVSQKDRHIMVDKFRNQGIQVELTDDID